MMTIKMTVMVIRIKWQRATDYIQETYCIEKSSSLQNINAFAFFIAIQSQLPLLFQNVNVDLSLPMLMMCFSNSSKSVFSQLMFLTGKKHFLI